MKRIIAVLMAVVLAAGILAGCGEKEQAVNGDGLEYVKLVVYLPSPGSSKKDVDLVEAEINKYLLDKLNCEIDLELPDFGIWTQKIPMKYQAQEQIDLTWTCANFMIQDLSKNVYLELDDLYETYGQGIKEVVEPILIDGSKVNGKMYGIPVNKEIANNRGIYYVKDIVEKYNIDVSAIKKMEDLEPALETIKQNEPGMVPFNTVNGLDALPYSDEMARYEGIEGLNTVVLDTETDKMVNPFEVEEFRSMLKVYERWNKAGYMSKEKTAQGTADELIKAGKNWNTVITGKPGTVNSLSKNIGVQMVEGNITKPVVSTNSLMGSMTVIPFTSKNPERAMMLLNLLYTDKYLNNLLIHGIEGKHYVLDENGMMQLPDGAESVDDTGYSPGIDWIIGNQFLNNLWYFEDADKWEQYQAFNESASIAKSVGFLFDSTSVSNEIAAISADQSSNKDGFYKGEYDVDTELPKYNARLKELGNDKIIEEAQRQYDEWKKTKTN